MIKKCKKCLEPLTEVINKNGVVSFKCFNCQRSNQRRLTQVKKLRCIEYMGGECSMCGYKKCFGALEFHHIDPTTKSFEITAKLTKSFEILKPELDKCILVCANCHREIHHNFIKK